jgi:FkbM family methyltransferase
MADIRQDRFMTRNRQAIQDTDFDLLRQKGYDPDAPRYAPLRDVYLGALNNGEFDHLGPLIDPRKASLDVGANRGIFTLKLAAASSRVVAIEPLQECAFLGDLLPSNCIFCNCAVGDEDGELELKTPLIDGNPAHGMSTFSDLEQIGYKDHVSQRTRIERIDAIVERELGGEPVGFIKMDVEGWEDQALRGAENTIKRDRPNLLVELWPQQMPDGAHRIEELGYRGFFYFDHKLHSLTAFRHSIHTAPENDWNPKNWAAFRPELHVNNFFFVPV